jgi:hypothetical protein
MTVAVPDVSCSWPTNSPLASSVGAAGVGDDSSVAVAVGAASLTVVFVKKAHGSNNTRPARSTATATTTIADRLLMAVILGCACVPASPQPMTKS